MKESIVNTFSKVVSRFGTNSQDMTILEKMIKIIIILIITRIVIKIVSVVIDKFFKKQRDFKYKMEDRKANTLAAILKSISRYAIYFIAIVPILELFGITPASVLAAAGVGGIAIGFGAQSLVKDVITGFFILFEDQYSVGDFIKTGEFEGIVEEIGLRTTKIRAFSGDLHIVPNGNITAVTNRCRGSMRAWVDVSIAYEEDIENALTVLKGLCEDIAKNDDRIVEGPTVLGVSSLGSSDIVISIIAKTKPMEQWAVEREMRKRIKEEFDRKNIEIPYPRRVVINKES